MKTDSDSVIREVRESRIRMSEQSGHDPFKFIEHLKTFNRKYATQVKRYTKRQYLGPPDSARIP